MAYMNQEKKKEIAQLLKEKLKGRDIKFSLAVDNHSTIVLNIRSGGVDFIGNFNQTNSDSPRYNARFEQPAKDYLSVNHFWIDEHFTGEAKEILEIANNCLNLNNYDNSDAMTDYFDVGHYVDINVGKWDKAYQLTTGEK
jgi:hypothetical protein